jgi:hypothetical protein
VAHSTLAKANGTRDWPTSTGWRSRPRRRGCGRCSRPPWTARG